MTIHKSLALRALDGEVIGPDEGFDVVMFASPFSSARRTVRVPFGLSVNDVVAANFPNPRIWSHVECYLLNPDETDSTIVPPEMWRHVRLKPGAKLVVRVKVRGGGGSGGKSTLAIVLTVLVLAVAFVVAAPLAAALTASLGVSISATMAFSAVSMVGRLLVSALVPPPQPESKSGSGTGTQRVFALTGVSNKAAAFEPAPRVYGKMKIFPPLASAPWNEVIGEFDTYLRMLFNAGPGPLKLSDFRIGETPIENFQDVQIEVGHVGDLTGAQPPAGTYYCGFQDDRTTLTLFPTSAHQEAMSVKVDKNSNITRSFRPDIDEGRVVTTFPKGCIFYHTDGRRGAAQVVIQAHWREIGAGSGAWMPLIPSVAYLGRVNDWVAPVNNYPFYDDGNTPVVATIAKNWDDVDYLARYPDVAANYNPSADTYDVGNTGGGGFPAPARTFARGFHHYIHIGAWSGYTPSWLNPTTAKFILSDQRDEPVYYVWRTPPLDDTKEYEFRFNRVYGYGINFQGASIIEEFWLNSTQGFETEPPVNVKGHALIALRIKASEQLNGTLDNFSCMAEAILPQNWTGTNFDTPALTRSPAHAYLDVLRGKSNLRAVADSRIDFASIKAWHDFCVTLNANGNPQCLFDGVFDARTTVLQALRSIANTARADFAMKDGKYSVIWDAAQSTPVQIFTPKNSVNFQGKKIFATSPHALNMRFTNPDKLWSEDQVTVYSDGYDADNATNFEQVEAFGLTRPEQVHWYGRYLLAVNLLRPEMYSVEADIESLVCRRGNLVRISHDVPRFGIASGRVRGVTTAGPNVTALTVDETVHVDVGKTYAARARLNDGTIVLMALSMGAVETDTKVLTLTTPLAIASAPAVGDLFAYGETSKETVECLVRNIYRLDDLKARLELVDYSPAIFAVDTEAIPPFDTQSSWPGQGVPQPPPVPVIASVVSDETAMIQVPAGWQNAIRIGISNDITPQVGQVRADDYIEVQYGFIDGGYYSRNLHFLSNPKVVTITPVFEGETYRFRLRRVTAVGVASAWCEEQTHEVVGRTAAPTTPTGFTGVTRSDGVFLSWESNPEHDIDGYELRVGASWDGGTQLEPGKSPTTKTTQYLLPPQTVGVYTYRLKSLDTIGNISVVDATVLVTINAPAVVVPVAAFSGADVVISWPAVAGSHRVSFYRLKIAAAAPIDIYTTNAVRPAQWSGDRVFEVWAVDVAGNEGPHGSVSVTITTAAAAGNFAHAFNQGVSTFTWDAAVAGSVPVSQYELRYGGADWASSTLLARVNATSFATPANWSGARTFRVRAIDSAGNLGAEATRSVTINAPAAIAFAANLVAGNVTFTWTEPASTVPIKEYEIRHGAAWNTGTSIATLKALSFTMPIDWTASRTFWIAARTLTDIEGTPASLAVAVTAPTAPALAANFIGPTLSLNWNVPAAALQIARYEVRYGADWATGTSLGFVDGTNHQEQVTWGGSRLFFVAAIDAAGNVGSAASIDAVVVVPGTVQGLAADIVDNNVLLRWSAPAMGNLPVDHYEVRRGATWAGATSFGEKSGTFTSILETAAGTYTYWVTAFDSADNMGTPVAIQAVVNQPPDYVLKANYAFDLTTGTLTNAILDDGAISMPFITGRTFAEHFTDNSWTTPQGQIDAGFPIYAQPTTTSDATAVFVFDYGTSIPSANITVTPTFQTIAGTITLTGKIRVSSNGSTWFDTTANPGWTALASTFRYVEVTVKAVGTSTTAVGLLSGLTVRLDLKQITDAGMATANSGDSGGTTVTFNKAFIDVDSLTVTPEATTAIISAYDFTDEPNPTSFKVLLFNTAGARVSGDFSWTARGV